MLTLEPTKYAAGVTIWGDYYDLRTLHTVIHEIVEMSPYREEVGTTVMGLAYVVRKSYERMYEEKTFGFDEMDQVTYLGGQIVWPYLIVHARLLREMAGYGNTTKLQQSQLYLLESQIEKALMDCNPEAGRACIEWLNQPFPISDKYYLMYIDNVARQYVDGPQGKARIKKLPKLLDSLNPYSNEYKSFAKELELNAKSHGCSPHELVDRSEWFDFKW